MDEYCMQGLATCMLNLANTLQSETPETEEALQSIRTNAEQFMAGREERERMILSSFDKKKPKTYPWSFLFRKKSYEQKLRDAYLGR